MTARKSLFALIIAALVFTGCASIDPVADIRNDEGVKSALKAGPIPASAVAMPVVDSATDPGEGEAAARIPVKLEKLYDELVTALKEFKSFRGGVLPLESEKPVISGKDYAKQLEVFMKTAANKNRDILISFNVKKFRLNYKGTNSNHFSSILLWVSLWWPSWFVADETYTCEVEMEVRVYSVKKKTLIESYPITITREFELDDFQRGWQFFGIMRVPGSLGEGNWKGISDIFEPHVARDLKARVISYMGGRDFREKVLKNIVKESGEPAALVIGVDKYKDKNIKALGQAENDAASVRNKLLESGTFKSGDIRLLTGKNATLKAVRARLDEIFTDRLKDRPKVFVYFAGHGIVTASGPALALYDCEPASGKGCLTINALAGYFNDMPVNHLAFIADTGFGAPKRYGRGISKKEDTARLTETYINKLRANSGRAVLFSSTAGENAAENKRLKHGMFTYFMLSKFKKADSNGDGLSLEEIFNECAPDVSRQSKLMKIDQTPVLQGPAIGKPFFKK